MLGTVALASGLTGARAAGQDAASAKAVKLSLSRELAVPQMSSTFERIYPHVLDIPAFNHHFHFGKEEETLAWYHPQKTIGMNEFASRGIVPGIMQLLDIPGDTITPEVADEVADRFATFVRKKSRQELV